MGGSHPPPFIPVDFHLEQAALLLQTPVLLNALLNIATSRNWLAPTLAVMRLHAHLAQALPLASHPQRLKQLPGITDADATDAGSNDEGLDDFLHKLESKNDSRAADVKKALAAWGRVEIVDAAFRGAGLLI